MTMDTDLVAKSPTSAGVFTDVVAKWLVDHFAWRRNASKHLAEMASLKGRSVSHRTAESWLRNQRTPSLDNVLVLAAQCDDLAARLDKRMQEIREHLKKNS